MIEKNSNPPGTSRNVSFYQGKERSDVENQVLFKVQEVVSGEVSEDVILKAIRKHPECKNEEQFIYIVIDDVLNNPEGNPVFGPETATAATDPMEVTDVVPFVESDLQKALQESMKLSSTKTHASLVNVDIEEMIRNPLLSTGLSNSGNTCWFNSLAQLLFSLPQLRTTFYNCLPTSWENTPIPGIDPEIEQHAALLVHFRYLFAELQFSPSSHTEAGKLLQIVDSLFCSSRVDIQSTIGTQQDASEMLILIFGWLEIAFNAALSCHLKMPESENVIENNLVVADSSTEAPNSDVAGTTPPVYDATPICEKKIGGSEIVCTKDILISRSNSPIKKNTVALSQIETRKSELFSENSRAACLPSIKEVMDSSEGYSCIHMLHPSPLPAKIPRIPAVEPLEVITELERNQVKFLENQFNKMFVANCYTTKIFNDGTESPETVVRHCPKLFHLQIDYGNLHDALEASTYDTGCDSSTYTGSENISFDRNLCDPLPAVIFMGLSRFGYKNGHGPNKLHDRFTFPRKIFMDRYLKCNAEKVSEIRKQQNELRAELALQKAQFNGLQSYPNKKGEESRLVEVFETALEALSNCREREAPKGIVTAKTSPCPNELAVGSKFVRDLGKHFPSFKSEHFSGLDGCIDTLKNVIERLTEEEMVCRKRYEELEQRINCIFDTESLQKHEYELHAMIVHSGEANRGHYWTYRLKRAIDNVEVWEKLNDQKTEIVDFHKVEADAFGTGSSESPSAYLLMYVRTDADWLTQAENQTDSQALSLLPTDLRLFIEAKRAEFTERLSRFREQKVDGSQDDKKKKHFSWFNSMDEQICGDVNANLSISSHRLEDPLYSYSHKEIASEEEISEINRITHRLWNTLTSIVPSMFENADDILKRNLESLMKGPFGGIAYIEDNLSYPLSELRNDAENDITRVYNKFITDYCDDVLDSQQLHTRSRFVLYVKKLLPNVKVSVLRYLLVRALAITNHQGLSKRANEEIARFRSIENDASNEMERIVSLLSHIYELGHLAAWGINYSLRNYVNAMNAKSGEITEFIYLAMLGARTARVCHRVLLEETVFLDQPSVVVVDQRFLELCTVLPLLSMTKSLIGHLVSSSKSINEMEFYNTERDIRVPLDDIILEIRYSVARIHTWYRLESSGYSIEDRSDISDDENVENFKDMTINVEQVYDFLNATFDLVCGHQRMNNDENKLKAATKIRDMLLILEGNDEKSYRFLDWNPLDLQDEIKTAYNTAEKLKPVMETAQRTMSEIQDLISNSYA